MVNRFQLFLVSSLVLLISGCSQVISKDLRGKVDPSLPFSEVLQNPNTYKDKIVLWGGEVIQTVNQ